MAGRVFSPYVYELSHTVLGWIYRIVAAGHVALGAAILIGGRSHFPYPTYQPMLDLTRDSVVPWSAVIVVSGVMMLVPKPVLNLVGLGVGFLWFNLFSAMFVAALVQYPGAGSTAPIPYALLGAIHVALLTLKVAEVRDAHSRGTGRRWIHR